MKRAALGAILVMAVVIAAGFGVYAATTGDDDKSKAGGTPAGLTKCRADDPNCLARVGGQEGDSVGDRSLQTAAQRQGAASSEPTARTPRRRPRSPGTPTRE